MQSHIQVFINPQFGEIRIAKTENGDPLFCLSDLCKALNLSNASVVASRLDEDERSKLDLGRQGSAIFVTEPGMYSVILRSDSPLAKPMQKWVTSEVLPAIRKTGGYIPIKQDDTPETIMARALLIADSTIKRQAKQLEDQEPKVLFAKAVETSSRSCLIAELAKIITQNGVQVGQNRLFQWMRRNGFLCQHGDYYNQPTQKAMEMGLFEIKKTTITKPDGRVLTNTTPKVTGKGQVYFVNKFLYNKTSEGN